MKRQRSISYKAKMEQAVCSFCGEPFERRAGRSNPKRYCDKPLCQKVKKLPHSVAKFSDLPKLKPTKYGSDIRYHGSPLS